MSNPVIAFDELREADWAAAGGKAASLARLRLAGYPVPDGFVILPAAFAGAELGYVHCEGGGVLRNGDETPAPAVSGCANFPACRSPAARARPRRAT